MAVRMCLISWFLLCLVGCQDTRRTPPTTQVERMASAEPGDAPRDLARMVLEEACGECHISATGGLPGALRVFDLSESDWAASLTPAQAADIDRRLGEPSLPSMFEVDGRTNTIGPAERELVRDYLETKVGLESTAPPR